MRFSFSSKKSQSSKNSLNCRFKSVVQHYLPMESKKIHFGLLAIAFFLFIAFLLSMQATTFQYSGLLLISCFISLAFAVRGFETLKGFSFSFWILTAVTASMYYPSCFFGTNTFDTKILIVPLLQIIMFGMGSQMSLNDFAGVLKMPKGVIIGICCQFTIMPVVGIVLALSFGFPAEIAAGIVLVGASPSGMASNVMAFLAKANLALSVTLTAVATLLAPVMTPLLMKIFGGQLIAIDFWGMMLGIFDMVILPICAGLIFNLFYKSGNTIRKTFIQLSSYGGIILLKNAIAWSQNKLVSEEFFVSFSKELLIFIIVPIVVAVIFNYFAKGKQESFEKILSLISMLGIGIIICIITASGRDSLLDVGLLLILACFLHNMLGYGLGYGISKLFKMSESDCRTIAIEVGMQNGGLASGLALQLGKVSTVGLAPAIFGPLMNVTGSSLATWWRGKTL